MNNLPGFFRLARNVSKHSTHHKHHLGAVLVSSGNVISVGFNKGKSDSKGWVCGIHAEMSAIHSSSRDDLKGAVMFVYRERKDGSLGMARPCQKCMEVLREKKIKRVYYTTSEYPYFEIEDI